MALPSQASSAARYRARSSRGTRRRRRGGRRGGGRRVFALIVLVAVIAAAWWYWPAPEDTSASDTLDPATTASTPTTTTTTNRATQPVSLPPHAREPDVRNVETPAKDDEVGDRSPPRELHLTTGSDEARETGMTEAPVPAPANPTPVTREAGNLSGADLLVASGVEAHDRGDLLLARDLWNRALHHESTAESDRRIIRDRLARLSEDLVFSQRVVPGDPIGGSYVVRPNDSLGEIVTKLGLGIDYRLVARLNGIRDASKIRVGQTLKTVKGPFHAVITKSAFRLDLYADATDGDGSWLYVRSWPVGLGEDDITPVGEWRVVASRRLVDPAWTNPRTGEHFDASDPGNPIGDRWIPLEGTDEVTRQLSGYGIHGTIDPDSIGKQRSMGCIRLLPEHIEVLYEFLSDDDCRVVILP